ncbi:MAG: outer membrane protein transport protein, partial [Deltaproteobacteria bacterium]|nr:outer membrane protein transport protein [Deltaproteobacteria bacterium]
AAPLDAMVPATNPAGLTEVGNRLDLGLVLFNPNREYSAGDIGPFNQAMPGTVESDTDYFVIPNLGWSKQLDNRSAVGIALYGNGGMNTDYPERVYYDPDSDSTGVDLMQLFIAPTLATKLTPTSSIGISPLIAVQFFEAKGLGQFAGGSSAPTKLTNNGHDSSLGFGARIGYLGEITQQLSIGLAYQTKMYMEEYDDYAGLFAEQGDFDIPANWTVGFAYKPTPAVTLAVDVQRIYYSDIKSINNPLPTSFFGSSPGDFQPPLLGENDGPGFAWDDMTVFKIGLQWARSEQWTYRFGYSYGDQPISSSEVLFNILAPGVIEQHASFGFTYTFANQSELDFSLTYAFENDVEGNANFGQPITLTMNQWEVGLGYAWKF